MSIATVQDRHDLGTGLIDRDARSHLRKFAEQIAENLIAAQEPEAGPEYREYVTDTVQTWLADSLDEITVQTSADWYAVNDLGERADLDASVGGI